MQKWAKSVKTKWHPDPGLFTKSANVIAKRAVEDSKSLRQAMARVTFYENRAGANLSPAHRRNIEEAKKKIRTAFAKMEKAKPSSPARHKSAHPRAGSAYWYAYEANPSRWIKGRNPYRTKGRAPIRYLGRKPIAAIGKGPFHLYLVEVRGQRAYVAQLLGAKR